MSRPDHPADPADGAPTRAYPAADPTHPYPGPPAAPHPGYALPPAPPPTNGLALAAMIVSISSLTTGCLPVGVVGAIMGHRARRQIAATGESGSGFALAGIVVGWIGLGLLIAVIILYAVLFATGELTSS